MGAGAVETSARSAALPVLLGVAVVALGWNLGGHRLLDPDEGRNAEVAREMMLSNDYVVPQLDGLPYLDKPVVYFAAAALVMEVLGPTETAARLPAFVATLMTVALVIRFARRRWGAAAGPDVGWIAGVALATMLLVLAYARTTIFDSTLALCTTAAILWFYEDRPVWAWAALGLGVLTKGPVALAIALGVMGPFFLLTGRPLRRLVPLAGIAAFFAVALPWFVAVSLQQPEFPHYVFVRETFERVTTTRFHRTAPYWYYLPILPLAAFPWIVPAAARLGRWKEAWRARRSDPSAADAVFLLCWVLGPLVFFTLNQSKLPQYVLPLMPAFALAAARGIATHGIGLGSRAYAVAATVLGLVLIAIAIWLPTPIKLTPEEQVAIPPAAAGLGVVLIVSGLLVTLAAPRDRRILGLAGYALCVISVPFAGGPLLQAVGFDRSAYRLATAIAATQSAEVIGVAAYPPSLPFYLQRSIPVATATGRELTSNWIADQHEAYRARPGSPLRPADSWRDVLATCPVPTVFVARDREIRAELAARLPVIAAEGRYAAFGPCRSP